VAARPTPGWLPATATVIVLPVPTPKTITMSAI
jgi:hypothetical protein